MFAMEIQRDVYLQRLIQRRENGMIKVITGIRRCGKSYLLFSLYHRYLIEHGVAEDHIIELALDDIANKLLRDGEKLYRYIRNTIDEIRKKESADKKAVVFVFLDEIQFVPDFSDVMNGLLRLPGVDVYVTGSNSRMLSTDILTEFRGRGDEVRVFPLSFAEFWQAYQQKHTSASGATKPSMAGIPIIQAWNEYYTYGGMPLILSMTDDKQKSDYLRTLFAKVYLSDICERNDVKRPEVLDAVLNILSSSVGSLTNPKRISDTFRSNGIPMENDGSMLQGSTTSPTIAQYIKYCEEAFLIQEAQRFDVKGKHYVSTPLKYYFTDVGLRNARLRFRQQEENHIMENILYNELVFRGYEVDVGVVTATETNTSGKRQQIALEIDFVVNRGNQKYYIQSAFEMATADKLVQERRPLLKVTDSFKKIILVRDMIAPKRDESGIVTMSLLDFLLDENAIKW